MADTSLIERLAVHLHWMALYQRRDARGHFPGWDRQVPPTPELAWKHAGTEQQQFQRWQAAEAIAWLREEGVVR